MTYQHNAHTQRAAIGPAREPSSPFLPIDTPPVTTRLPASALVGLSWEFDPGEIHTPVSRPWTQYQSTVFPNVHPSSVGPDFIAPRYGYSENHYSPVAHRLGGVLMERNPPPPIVRPQFRGHGRRSLGRSTGRIRGAVTPFPAVNPSWRSMFTNAMTDGNG